MVGQICQVSHEFRYGTGPSAGSAPVRIGWGITLVLDMSDDTCTLAAIEGRSAEETGVLLNARLERLVTALVD